MLDEALDEGCVGLVEEAQGACDCARDQGGVGQRGEFDRPDAIGELAVQAVRDFKGQAAFARAACARQRHEPMLQDERLDLRHLVRPANEAAQLKRQVIGTVLTKLVFHSSSRP